MTKKTQIIIAGLSGLTAVAFGAFGAHGLKNIISPSELEAFKTGVLYHLIHSVLLFALARGDSQKFVVVFILILAGVILFSFSLYLYAISGITLFAIITPIGGVCFLIGWLLIIIISFKNGKI